ncbi:MAG: ABC transporter ATP-binding protein [Myxococcota bacterium]
MMTLDQLTKSYRTEETETLALDEVSLDIEAGEFVAIMGPSGCGKSTLLNIIGLIDSPTSGQYLFQGVDVSNASERRLAEVRKKNIGFIFQSFNLIDELTVAENVELALLYQKFAASERRRRVDEILDEVHLLHRRNHRPPQLSGGQQQRVAVARAVVGRPALILADEPTGNLDTAHGQEVMGMLRKLHEGGTTVVMVTHSPAHADFAQRTINLLDGRVVTESLRAAV